jgi:hypothetical protein
MSAHHQVKSPLTISEMRIAWSVLYRERGYDAGIATQVP